MCGIVYARNFSGKNVNNTIVKRFDAQRGRGTTSFGFYDEDNNNLTTAIKEKDIKRLLTRKEHKGVLFHHRFSTSTEDVRNACHPFSTKKYFKNQYIGVHNGVIRNPDDLKAEHSQRGISYVSTQPNGQFNDSEALIYDLASYLEGKVDEITAKGSIAFIMTKLNEYGKAVGIFFGRNSGNPLVMKLTKNSLTISSEGEGESVPVNKLHYFDFETKEVIKSDLTLPYRSYQYSTSYSGGYSGYSYPNNYYDYTGQQLSLGGSNKSKKLRGEPFEIAQQALQDAMLDYDRAEERILSEYIDLENEITDDGTSLENNKLIKSPTDIRKMGLMIRGKTHRLNNLEEAIELINLDREELNERFG